MRHASRFFGQLYERIAALGGIHNAVRYYDLEVLAKLGAGLQLDAVDRERLGRHLLDDQAEISRLARAA